MNTREATKSYLMGHSDEELKRLEGQARMLAPATVGLLNLAGICPGMRILDLGTGLGDVAFLAAELVGDSSSVVGIDNSAVAIASARDRAQRDKVGNVSFVEGDILNLDLEPDFAGSFDAIIGRLVLLYVSDPVEVLTRILAGLRPGGVLLSMEYDMSLAGATPKTSLSETAMEWLLAAFEDGGHDPAFGARLGPMLSAAGAEAMQSIGFQAYYDPSDPAGPRLLATTIRSLLPTIVNAGIATAEQVGIETLEQRLAFEILHAHAVVRPPILVGAWGRTPTLEPTIDA